MISSIATIGSHTALQILHGAKLEGFRTILITTPKRTKLYKSFNVADEILVIENFEEILDVQDKLSEMNAILIPHGSFVEYIGKEGIKKLEVPIFGSKDVMAWESSRNLMQKWLNEAKIKVPRTYKEGDPVDKPVILKLPGAKGGKGYKIITSGTVPKIPEGGVAQEYIIGVPMYFHFFYSLVRGELEIMSTDIRYETNADGLGRIPQEVEKAFDIPASYVVVGIVAGTNFYVYGSPYTWIKYNEPMSTGRRIAREIKEAIEEEMLDEILS